ncbi:hypothetical protein SOVF_094050 isoform B [Spinacia oleracea]|nr:hypothetical protein SOVF_094050 isoform B [Spinacia oleracea]
MAKNTMFLPRRLRRLCILCDEIHEGDNLTQATSNS